MAQNIYDRPDFFRAYSGIPRQVLGLEGAPEWPVVRAMLPDLANARVLDLGCGFGWFARFARENGAARVLGLDLSENMIARARAMTDDAAIEYRIADLDRAAFEEASFDIAYSSLAFHYVEDFGRLARALRDALVPGGGFVFTIEHPIYMAPASPGWTRDAEGRKTWPVSSYAREGMRRTDWLAEGVVKYHRTLATTLNTLIDSGFVLQRIAEFAPTPEQIAARPDLAEEVERPMILIVSARRAA